MPVKYVPYYPNAIDGQAILNNFTRSQRALIYRESDQVYERIKRGMPYYEVENLETVGAPSENLVIRGECISACAYLKENNIKVDLVYIDPPFASGADYAKRVYIRRNPKLSEKIAEAEKEMDIDELKAFEEKMYGDIWKKEDYLNWMYENLTAIKSIMSEAASIYVHLDATIGHYVKILLDEVFGEQNFQREIIWDIQVLSGFKTIANNWIRGHDMIFYYSKNAENVLFNKLRQPHTKEYLDSFKGEEIQPDGSIRYYMTAHGLKRYRDEVEPKGKPFGDVWGDIMSFQQQPTAEERNGYATQKPESLLERIINANSNKKMVVADFFGGSGVTSKVANDLDRKFIHVDIGLNSIQTTRDRLKDAGASFQILEIKDGVSLFRNPQQTMDKLAKLIPGLQKNIGGLSNFWFGAISESKKGMIPVYVPDLINSQQKVLDIPKINQILNQELQELDTDVKKVMVYYIDIQDHKELETFVKNNNPTEVEIELRDLKNLLSEIVMEDEVSAETAELGEGFETTVIKIISDRLMQKINDFNQNNNLQAVAKGKAPNPIDISDEGLELIELVSVDCENNNGPWHSSSEIKIDKLGYTIKDGVKTKTFWDGKIFSKTKPKRLKVRNISGDETILALS